MSIILGGWDAVSSSPHQRTMNRRNESAICFMLWLGTSVRPLLVSFDYIVIQYTAIVKYNRWTSLVQADWLAHGGFDDQRFDVLPVLLQQRDQEVDGQHDVSQSLIISHVNVTDGNTQAQNLLQLELDG